MSKVVKIGLLACAVWSSYSLSVIAGNASQANAVTKTAVTMGEQLTSELPMVMAAVQGYMHSGKLENSALFPGDNARLKAGAWKDNAGWHVAGHDKAMSGEDFNKLLEKFPEDFKKAGGEPVQKGQAARLAVHKLHKTGCADLLMFSAKGIELTPAQQSELIGCKTPAKRGRTWTGYGVTVTRDIDGFVKLNGSLAAPIEQTQKAVAYQSGEYVVILYTNNRASLTKNGVVIGWLKP